MKRVLYFGNIDPGLSRNAIYMEGLRARGYVIKTCIDSSPGLRKYWRLFKRHWQLRNSYDVLIVGYSGYLSVPLARFIGRKPVIFDALCSFYETEILSRDAFKEMPFRVQLVRLVDWVAIKCAHYILVESDKQKKYFTETLGVDEKKCVTVYTGVDTRIFRIDPLVQKKPTFTVLFRGRIMSEAGVPTIIRSAKLLEDRGVHFLIIGHGCNQAMQEFNDVLREVAPKNVTHIDEQIPFLKLARLMQECHVSLGQFAHHDRLRRTIPHKAYESMALNIPYITARAAGASEVLVDKVTCLMVCPDDPQDLAEKIMMLFNNDELRSRLASNAYELCATRFMPSVVVKPLAQLIDMLP